jgi:hypothetical protein
MAIRVLAETPDLGASQELDDPAPVVPSFSGLLSLTHQTILIQRSTTQLHHSFTRGSIVPDDTTYRHRLSTDLGHSPTATTFSGNPFTVASLNDHPAS